jgi:hypothetical protein
MERLAKIRDQIYRHFHKSRRCAAYFIAGSHPNEYAAYYTAMYLLQDSTDGLWRHRKVGFNGDPLLAYIELWGVLQAVTIQQDSIAVLYELFHNWKLDTSSLSNWKELRDLRVACAGHPVDRGKPGCRERAFLGRSFGSYRWIMYEVWREAACESDFPQIELGDLMDRYAEEASCALAEILRILEMEWP